MYERGRLGCMLPIIPQTGLPMGSILEKKRLDTLVAALCCVGHGFGCAGRAGPGWARIWLC